MSALVSQRTKDSTISLTLPDIAVTMSRVYPFKRKNPVGKEKWYEKISLSYSASIKNSIDCKENYLFHSNFLKDWKNGVQHRLSTGVAHRFFVNINSLFFMKNIVLFLKRKQKSGMIKCKAKFKRINGCGTFAAAFSNNERGKNT